MNCGHRHQLPQLPCAQPGCPEGRANDRMRVEVRGELLALFVRRQLPDGAWHWSLCDEDWQPIAPELKQ